MAAARTKKNKYRDMYCLLSDTDYPELPDHPYEERKDTVELSLAVRRKFDDNRFTILTTDTGSGKTYVTIRSAALLSRRTILLVFAPKAKLMDRSWFKSVNSFNQTMHTDLQVYQFTYASLLISNRQVMIASALTQAREQNRKLLVVFDEVHEIKARQTASLSQTGQMAVELGQCPEVTNILGVSGSSTSNSYIDDLTYFILNGYYDYPQQFKDEQIATYDQYHQPLVKDANGNVRDYMFKDAPKLKRQIKEMSVYKNLDYLLPDAKMHTHRISLDNTIPYVDEYCSENFGLTKPMTHYELYHHLRKNKKSYFENSSAAFAVLRRVNASDPNRLNALGHYLYSGIFGRQPHPCLVYYLTNAERDAILGFLKAQKVFAETDIQLINGNHKDIQQPKKANTVVLIQYRAGGSAIEFPTAQTAIFYAPTYSWQDFKQAKGRNVRAVKNAKSLIIAQYRLCASGTIDIDVWNVIDSKRNFTQKIIDNVFTHL